MKVLGIDTTRKNSKIYVKNESIEYVENIDDKIKHSEGFFLYLEKALLNSKMELNDFDYFCGIVGPGSFTGIRIGMAVVKSFAKALNKKIVSLNLFEIVQRQIKNGVFLLNSTASNCYYATIKNSMIVESGVVEKDKIKNKFLQKIYILEEEQNLIHIEYNDINIIDNLSEIYFDALSRKIGDEDFGNFEPYYLQLSQAEKNLNG